MTQEQHSPIIGSKGGNCIAWIILALIVAGLVGLFIGIANP